uniref:Prolamin-like domain-containing protein n=1 Tax=Cajanus cajan TaxID=3821 RepID=A0A151QNF2_CAJCA|nr:hypothetical protein KK1_047652 [Cajanus cajan]
MATLSNFSLIVLCFMVSYALMVQTGFSREIPEPSNAPEPSKEYLINCAESLDQICGDEIFSAIFFGNKTVSSDCCDTLVSDVGKECNDDMINFILKSEMLPNINESQVLKRSEKVWNECVLQGYPDLEPTIHDQNDENLYN